MKHGFGFLIRYEGEQGPSWNFSMNPEKPWTKAEAVKESYSFELSMARFLPSDREVFIGEIEVKVPQGMDLATYLGDVYTPEYEALEVESR